MYICKIMSSNFGYIDIILLAMIAGFIILRLRNILGRKTGHQDKIYTEFAEKKFGQFKQSEESENKNLSSCNQSCFLHQSIVSDRIITFLDSSK